MKYKVNIMYGSVTPVVTYTFEGDKILAWSHAVHRDRNGVIIKTTGKELLSVMEARP